MGKLILVRHGQSQWNLENRFTGWVDVPLSPKGVELIDKSINHKGHEVTRRRNCILLCIPSWYFVVDGLGFSP